MEFRYLVAPLIIAFFTNPILFHKYLTEMVLNSNFHMDLSFQEKKKLFVNPLHCVQVTTILVQQENSGVGAT